MGNEPVGTRFWTGGLRLSLLSFYASIAFAVLLLLVLGRIWWERGQKLERLDDKVHGHEREVELLAERGEWTLRYYRIHQGLDLLALRRIPVRQRQMLAERLWELSRDYNFDPLLVLALVAHESKGNPFAQGQFRSGTQSGAVGLMQIKYETAVEMADAFGMALSSDADLLKPEVNLVVGTAYLMKLLARYGDLFHAIMAYNIGPGALDARLRSRQRLPVAYYDEVMHSYRELLIQLDKRHLDRP